MADRVTVSNLALSKLGEDDQIVAPDQDSHAARSIDAVWDEIRQAVLRDHKWNFAMQRAELASLVSPGTIYPWQYAYQLPDQCLRLVEILDPVLVRGRFELEAGRILADDAGPLYIRYIIDVAEPGSWDALFVEAMAFRLAFQIADRITGDTGRQKTMWAGYVAALTKAKGVDAKENPPIEFEDSSWITARYSGGDGSDGLRWGSLTG